MHAVRASTRASMGRGRRFGILSTYPPTACGLATFTAALAGGLERCGAADVGVVRINDGGGAAPDDRVVTEMRNGSRSSVAAAGARLDRFDVAIVQHEYGIYGGRDGDEVLELLNGLTIPCVVVAHTVLRNPTSHQRAVLEAVASAAARVVVMTAGAHERLCANYDVDARKVVCIPHGASTGLPAAGYVRAKSPYLLTWGLLGPGKGIERVIDAMAGLRDLRPRPQYVIAGCTHPKVLAAEGERYREMLVRRAWRNGTAAAVSFDASYRNIASLTTLVQAAELVVLPYDSVDQATSGVLVDAVAAGRPVIATAFPHAVELLGSGAGIVVPHDDESALMDALRRVLSDPGLHASMSAEAARLAPELSWNTVAGRYRDIADELCAAPPVVAR